MKRKMIRVGAVFLAMMMFSSLAVAEDWKEPSRSGDFNFGGMAGMGIIDANMGVSVVGTLARKILAQGFAKDITNPVWIEAAVGPVFIAGTTALSYSAHMRWDFEKDATWTFYALGGFGGNVMSGRTEFHPRFGIGLFWTMSPAFQWRAEVAADVLAVGINVPF